MTISYVSSSSIEATSITMPTHQFGDLLIMFAFNPGGTTVPTVPSGWINYKTRSANTLGGVIAFKTANSPAEASGTWTNATLLGVAAYRDDVNFLTIGNFSTNGSGASTTPTYLAMNSRTSDRWCVGAIGVNLNSQAVETPPTGMTFRTGAAGASVGEIALHDTNASAAWASSPTITVSSVAYHTWVLEIVDTGRSKFGVPTIGRGSILRGLAL